MMTLIKYIFICCFLISSVNAQSTRKDNLYYWSEKYSAGIIGNKEYKVNLIDSSRTSLFIKEALTVNNQLLSDKHLTLPDKEDLVNLFIINQLHQNSHGEQTLSVDYLIDSLLLADIGKEKLIDNYYKLIFISVGNKNQPFNMKNYDFHINNFGLQNKKERSIFYFRCMDLCYKQITGYMAASGKEQLILEYIDKYPRFDGKKYYEYAAFNFDDFKIALFNGHEAISYKSYFLNRIYTLLIVHLNCNILTGYNEEENSKLIKNSILLDETFWEYCSEDIVNMLKTIRDQ